MTEELAPVERSQATEPPADWERRYRAMVFDERALDSTIGFFLAYFRTFATPESAAELVRSGAILRDPQKRSYDTAIIIMEIIDAGFDSDRGRAALRVLNRAHTHVTAANDEYLYVLLSLLVVPVRWIDGHWSRPLTDGERASAARFYQELGERMQLRDVPTSYEDAAAFYDRFEEERVRPSEDTLLLFEASLGVLAQRLPLPLRPLTRSFLAALIEDDRILAALGLRAPSAFLSWFTFTTLRVEHRLPARLFAYTPHTLGRRVYPKGYVLGDDGPAHR